MVLPQTGLEGATVKAERVRQQVEALRFPDISENFRVTISIKRKTVTPDFETDS